MKSRDLVGHVDELGSQSRVLFDTTQGPNRYGEGPKGYREGPKCYHEVSSLAIQCCVPFIVLTSLISHLVPGSNIFLLLIDLICLPNVRNRKFGTISQTIFLGLRLLFVRYVINKSGLFILSAQVIVILTFLFDMFID